MEWVETTSKTIEDAKDLLLDQLGVDEQEAEFEILEEPKVGLFGRTRGVARVRARIRPKSPRPKDERRRRNGKGGRGRSEQRGSGKGDRAGADKGRSEPTREQGSAREQGSVRETEKRAPKADRTGAQRPEKARQERQKMDTTELEPADPAAIATALEGFLGGLVSSFALEATVSTEVEEGEVHGRIDGTGLGYLIGPGGGVIDAVQELARTFAQKESKGRQSPKVKIDVGAYRQNRKVELEQLVREVGAAVVETGEPHAFEPMGSVDRKTVHDTASEIDGVATISEGEDPRRRVVIVKA